MSVSGISGGGMSPQARPIPSSPTTVKTAQSKEASPPSGRPSVDIQAGAYAQKQKSPSLPGLGQNIDVSA